MAKSYTLVTDGVVLSRRPYGEFDTIATLYTEALGKLPARFIGVRRPKGKLKALAEPMVRAEHRLYLRQGSEWATATGGRIVDSYPGLRADFERTCQGLRLCELLNKLVPDRDPAPRKLELIGSFLSALERTGSAWLPIAFALRLMSLAGFGLGHGRPEGIDPALWAALHEDPVERLESRTDDEPARRRVETRLERALEELVERPLNTTQFNDSIRRIRFAELSTGGWGHGKGAV